MHSRAGPKACSPMSPMIKPASATTAASAASARRALLFFLSAQESYRQPLFSSREVFCGPDAKPRTRDGHPTAIRTPEGDVDVREILRQLPGDEQPDYLVVKADATGRSFPRHLEAVRGPKVLLVGDTHHQRQPLRRMVRYAQEEAFDFIIFDHTRHHAALFHAAGLRNLYWLPALDYGYVKREIAPRRSHPLTFVGQAGRFHPYRCWVLDQVRAAGLPLEVLRGSLEQTADFYADSEVTLNISLNGDLNLRVFEALAAGGFLLTDELAPASGLGRLFESGRHLETWKTPGELVEKIRHYLGRPQEALRIRRAGQAEIVRHHLPETKIREFHELIDSGRVNPRYDLRGESWWSGAAISLPAERAMTVYEALQETHRISKELVVVSDGPLPVHFHGLPRLRVTGTGAGTDALWWDQTTAESVLAQFTGTLIFAVGEEAARRPELAAWGFQPEEENSPVFRLTYPGAFLERAWAAGARDTVRERACALVARTREPALCLLAASYAERLGDRSLRRSALTRAVELDRNNQAGLIGLALMAREDGDATSTFAMIEEASRISPLPEGVLALRDELFETVRREPRAAAYLRAIGRWPTTPAGTPRKILVLTNLYPPQELGGYGRMMWEFAQGLRARGHELRVLTADVASAAKPPTADEREMESIVLRSLELFGEWKGGRPTLSPQHEVVARNHRNLRRWRDELQRFRPDFILCGNLDLLGPDLVQAALNNGFPVLHALGNAAPGYSVAVQPCSPRYWIGPSSDWGGLALRQAGYAPARVETVYPGARIDRFFRLVLPDTAHLRICFAGLVLPFKGPHVLIEALIRLHLAGVSFRAEIAGEAPDPAFLAQLQEIVREGGIGDKVRFTGFLDRERLAALFARSNVLVFPSQVPETFGISQVEAMAAGLVVITSATGGAKEVVRSGTDGLQYAAKDGQELAEKLGSLVRDRALMGRLQRAAQSRAFDFAVERSVERIEELMEEMLALPSELPAEGMALSAFDEGG